MTNFYRVMLGKQSIHAQQCLEGGFIGTDVEIERDLSGSLSEDWRQFNRQAIPEYLEAVPGKSRIAAGLACGALWTVSRGIGEGDVVLCPDGAGNYLVGTVTGDYFFAGGDVLPHRRPVKWSDARVPRADMSDGLKRTTGSVGAVVQLAEHASEIESLIESGGGPTSSTTGSSDVENPLAFALEKHLEDFLVANWHSTALAAEFRVFEEAGVRIGQQYSTAAGIIDILAVSHDGSRLLVIELKRGRISDVVVGQVLRYVGFVREQLADPHQSVSGLIIGSDDDPKLRWALSTVPDVRFLRYEITFKLTEIQTESDTSGGG